MQRSWERELWWGAVNDSNIVRLQYFDRGVALAKENGIPAQCGVTGRRNDGAVFLRYGSVDVALGWPFRCSPSPAEVIDTKDLDALGKIVEALARKWRNWPFRRWLAG